MKPIIQSPKYIGNYVIDEAKLIGKGTYGKIYPAYKKNSDIKLACKCISKKPLDQLAMYDSAMMKQTKEQFQRQITFHKKISDNKHIVRLEDMNQDDNAYYLFMEYCDSDLAKLLQKKKQFSQHEATQYMRQLCLGYVQIYRAKASHRDLKPENLLLKKGVLKIADFGFVREISTLTQSMTRSKYKSMGNNDVFRTGTLCGTLQYIPPNVLQIQNNSKTKYDSEKFDMWSMGIIYYLMIYGQRPFSGRTNEQLFEQIQKKQLHFPQEPVISEKTKNLVEKLLNKNEQERLEFKVLMKHLVSQQIEQKEKIRKIVDGKFKFLETLNEIMKLLYCINTKYVIFRKIFKSEQQKKKNKNFAYKPLTRLHELRKKKYSDLETNQQFKNITKYPQQLQILQIVKELAQEQQYKGRVEESRAIINEYEQHFYMEIKQMCEQSGSIQTLEDLLEIFFSKMQGYDISELIYFDSQILSGILSLFRMKEYVDNTLKSKKLLWEALDLKDSTKMLESIKFFLSTK